MALTEEERMPDAYFDRRKPILAASCHPEKVIHACKFEEENSPRNL
jgi:hypothetical protein